MEATKIIATGIMNGQKIRLTWQEGQNLKINDIRFIPLVKTKLLDFEINLKPMANNFIPEKKTALWYYLAFYKIFDKEPKILLNGDAPTMPYEEGVIY